MVDAHDSGSCSRKGMGVRISPGAPKSKKWMWCGRRVLGTIGAQSSENPLRATKNRGSESKVSKMFKDFIQKIRIYAARVRVERVTSPLFPKFKTTLFFLWIVAIFGLLYGRLYSQTESAQNVSLLITLISWIVAVTIALLADPISRLKLLLFQIVAIGLLLSFLTVVSITYTLLFLATNAITSIKISWIIGSILLGILTFYSLYVSLVRANTFSNEPYPGLRTAPLLFLVLAANYLIWLWPEIIRLFL
jgi:hypothetical protein